jgi:hypothetical protein
MAHKAVDKSAITLSHEETAFCLNGFTLGYHKWSAGFQRQSHPMVNMHQHGTFIVSARWANDVSVVMTKSTACNNVTVSLNASPALSSNGP